MGMRLISVIVPVYNAVKYLPRCIDSLLAQTYENIEVILIDDGSGDGSDRVCDRYAEREQRVRVIHKANGGVSAARNDGIEAANGEFIAFCDNDDFYAPGMLERLLGMCLENNCAVAQCFCEKGDAELLPTPERKAVKVFSSRDLLESFYANGTPYIWDKLYRREVWNGVRFPVGSYMHEDNIVVHRLYGAANRVAVTEEKLYYHFRNPNSVVGSGFNPRWAQDDPYSDRLEYAVNHNLPQLYADTLAKRFYQHGYLLVMNHKYNGNEDSRRAFCVEHRKLLHRYYREAVGSVAISTKDRLFIPLRRFAPPLFHLYNFLKWRVVKGNKSVRWGEVR